MCIIMLMCEWICFEDCVVKMLVKIIGKEKVGVLDISGFYVGLIDDVKVQFQKLEKQNVNSIVIDLCLNGGGVLMEVVLFFGLFIFFGLIVQVCDNNGKVCEDSDIDGVVYYKGLLVVLVDCFSVLVLEIFVVVMQDYGCVLIVGELIFGKGMVQ